MAFVEKNGQPSMEEILASIRRIVADDPSGVSPIIDLNRKPLDQPASSAADGVGADDSPDFELPSMFRSESRSGRSGQMANPAGGIKKSAPIGRLTDAIRNVGPKVAAVSSNGLRAQHSPTQASIHKINPQMQQAPSPQVLSGSQPIDVRTQERSQPQTTQSGIKNGDAEFGGRPKPAQSLSSLGVKGEAAQGRGINSMDSSQRNGSGSADGSGTNGHAAALKKINGVALNGASLNGTSVEADAAHHNATTANPFSQTAEPTMLAAVTREPTVSKPTEPIAATPQSETPAASVLAAATGTGPKSSHEGTSERVAKVATPTPGTPRTTPRVMAAFRDTRMNMMGPSAGAPPSENSDAQSVPVQATPDSGSDIGSIVPSTLDLPGRGIESTTDGTGGSTISSDAAAEKTGALYGEVAGGVGATPLAHGNADESTGVRASETETHPPPLPEASEAGAPQQIEDATADLLRPMLRQWLSDNMPRMVEKALHIEVAETVRTGKPTDGS